MDIFAFCSILTVFQAPETSQRPPLFGPMRRKRPCALKKLSEEPESVALFLVNFLVNVLPNFLPNFLPNLLREAVPES